MTYYLLYHYLYNLKIYYIYLIYQTAKILFFSHFEFISKASKTNIKLTFFTVERIHKFRGIYLANITHPTSSVSSVLFRSQQQSMLMSGHKHCFPLRCMIAHHLIHSNVMVFFKTLQAKVKLTIAAMKRISSAKIRATVPA